MARPRSMLAARGGPQPQPQREPPRQLRSPSKVSFPHVGVATKLRCGANVRPVNTRAFVGSFVRWFVRSLVRSFVRGAALRRPRALPTAVRGVVRAKGPEIPILGSLFCAFPCSPLALARTGDGAERPQAAERARGGPEGAARAAAGRERRRADRREAPSAAGASPEGDRPEGGAPKARRPRDAPNQPEAAQPRARTFAFAFLVPSSWLLCKIASG
jgi:hypothetical protein